MPVATQVVRHADDTPNHPALMGPRHHLTYGELAGRITRHRGFEKGALAPISEPDPVDAIVAALAADLAGATPLICDPARPRIARDLPAASPLPDGGWACFSSGSTGRPRAIIRTRASWTGSYAHLDALTSITRDDLVLIPGPLVSSLYGFAAMHALATGATAIVPGRWPAGAAQIREATVVHVVPHLLPELLRQDNRIRVAVVGGAALDSRPAGIKVVSYYGATELSFVAVDTDGTGLRPFPEVEIEVRDGEIWARSPWLAEGYLGGAPGPLRKDADGWATVGDLAAPNAPNLAAPNLAAPNSVPPNMAAPNLAAPNVAPSNVAPSNVAPPNVAAAIAAVPGRGLPLRVRGRGEAAIQTGGATVVPEDVETVLRRVSGVREIVVIGAPHPDLGQVVTAVVEGPVSRRALEAIARENLDPAQRPRRWYTATQLPRTPTGKPARAQIAADLPGLERL